LEIRYARRVAWDTARTRQRLLDAAVEEFAAYGLDGARVDRIAVRAGVNKERIYQYFGAKHRLFEVVLAEELNKLAAAHPLTVEQAGDLGLYAGQIFDYHREHPQLVRLLHWEGLQAGNAAAPPRRPDDPPLAHETSPDERGAYYLAKVAALREAGQAGALTTTVDPEYLLYAVIALAAWWFAVPRVAAMIIGPTAADDHAARREALVTMVRRLTDPH
jgi:AcrR family transcriptional regulator